jgi:hypothetical protein
MRYLIKKFIVQKQNNKSHDGTIVKNLHDFRNGFFNFRNCSMISWVQKEKDSIKIYVIIYNFLIHLIWGRI